jgi:hypothetical protein
MAPTGANGAKEDHEIAILIECFVAEFIIACAAARIKDSYRKQKSN